MRIRELKFMKRLVTSKVTRLKIPPPDHSVDNWGILMLEMAVALEHVPYGIFPLDLSLSIPSLTCPKFHSREFDKTHVWVSVLASVCFDDMVLYTVTLTKVKLLFVLFLLDHHNLLGVLVLLSDAFQSPKGFVEVMSPVPSVPVFGKAAYHV